MRGRGGAYRLGQFFIDRAQDDGRLTFELGDHAQGDVQAQHGPGQALDGAFGQAELGGQEAEHGPEPRSEGAGRDALGQRGPGRRAAVGAGQAVDLVLDDFGADRGNLSDLMAEGLGVDAVKARPTPGAGGGLAGDGVGQLLRGHQGPGGPLVAGLSTPLLAREGFGRLTLEVDGVSGRGPGGVAGVGVEAVLKRPDLLLQGDDVELHRLDEDPDLDGQGVPDMRWQRWSWRHDINSNGSSTQAQQATPVNGYIEVYGELSVRQGKLARRATSDRNPTKFEKETISRDPGKSFIFTLPRLW